MHLQNMHMNQINNSFQEMVGDIKLINLLNHIIEGEVRQMKINKMEIKDPFKGLIVRTLRRHNIHTIGDLVLKDRDYIESILNTGYGYNIGHVEEALNQLGLELKD